MANGNGNGNGKTEMMLVPKKSNGVGKPSFFSKIRMGVTEIQKGARAVRSGQLESAKLETQRLREQIRLERERGKLQRLQAQASPAQRGGGFGLDFGLKGFGQPKTQMMPVSPRRRKVRQSKVIRIRRRGKLIRVRIV